MKKVKINGVIVKVFEKKDLVEKLKLEDAQANLILQYQKKFPELLQDVDGFVIDARSLWVQLGEPYSEFAKWVKKKIVDKGFIKNIDYEVFEQKVDNLKGGRPTTEYVLTVDTAKNICMMENTDSGRTVREYFILIEKTLKHWIEWVGEREPQKEGYNLLKDTLSANYKLTHDGKEASPYIYTNEANMLDVALFGRTSKQMKAYLGIKKEDALREHLGVEANKALRVLQDYDRELIMAGDDFQERKRRIKITCNTRFLALSTRVEEVKCQLESA
nr:MAG TPA: AntA/AntB antirepressor [Caudoviricetes sp.]